MWPRGICEVTAAASATRRSRAYLSSRDDNGVKPVLFALVLLSIIYNLPASPRVSAAVRLSDEAAGRNVVESTPPGVL